LNKIKDLIKIKLKLSVPRKRPTNGCSHLLASFLGRNQGQSWEVIFALHADQPNFQTHQTALYLKLQESNPTG